MFVLAALLLSAADTPPAKVTWIWPEDYPAELVRSRAKGTVEFVLTFNEAGRVNQCLITKSAGKAMLDATACRLARSRARRCGLAASAELLPRMDGASLERQVG